MLFDLRGAGRRRTVKVVYVTLALLMGGGLVLFGIGGEVSGGLVDAITERSGGDDGSARFAKQEKDALAKTKANPEDAAAWAALARARFQLTGRARTSTPRRAPSPPLARPSCAGPSRRGTAISRWTRRSPTTA